MADEDCVVIATINYWCREKHYRQMNKVAVDAQRKYTNDPFLRYFIGCSMIFEGRVQEGMRELDPLINKSEINLCSTLALIYAHRLAKNIDTETVALLDSKLKSERKSGNEKSFYFAGLFLVQIKKYDKAREYVDRAVKMNPRSGQILSLKGWLELLGGDESASKSSIKFFEEALKLDGTKTPDAYFGKIRQLEMHRNYMQALDVSSQAVVAYPDFLPAFIEKMRLQLALQDWDQTCDTAQRALEINRHCLHAKKYLILQLLCKEGNYPEASGKIAELLDDFKSQEPQNSELLHEFARVFCRVSGRNAMILQQTYSLQEKAVAIDNTNPDLVAELGYELMMAGKSKDAMTCYRNALKIDETSLFALTGLINCQLLENQADDAAGQLEFLAELKDSVGTSAELIYLSALLAMKRNKSSEKVIALLNKAIDTHFVGMRGLPLGSDYFLALNPNFLTQIMSDYLTFAPQLPLTKSQPPSPVLEKCLQVLEPLCKAVPGLLEGLYLMAKAKFLSGDIEGATALLNRCLEHDRTSSDCHILMSQIHLNANDLKSASQSLEFGLSYNFEVREHPVYHLIKARILKKQGDLREALKTLQQAMLLPGVKVSESRSSVAGNKKKSQVSVNDRVSLYIELADTHRLLNEQPEAAKVMQDAINNFQGTGEEARLTIANVDLSLARGDLDGAIEMLRNIGPDQPYFIQAREKMASVYLNHRKDKRLYAACYRELADKFPSQQTSLLLGDAYMNIQEPERAIEVYEQALKKTPKDSVLASKIGQALVKTHQFGKAINYYEAALKQGGPPFLRYDLAELLIRLKQYEKAEKILVQVIEGDVQGAGLDTFMEQSHYHQLLGRVYELQGRQDDKLEHLNKAKEIQDRVVLRAAVEQPETLGAQRKFAATIYCKLAEHNQHQGDYKKAIKSYREALAHTENNSKVMLELARLYMMTDDLASCQRECTAILWEGKEKDAASVMMADIMFRQNDYEKARAHYQQILQDKPDNYAGLARIIELLRRAGQLEEVPSYLSTAAKSSGRSGMDAGFNYCTGLYLQYTGNPNDALNSFNKARKDSDYGTDATYRMVEICLNPDNDTMGGELFEGGDQGSAAAKTESEKAALKTADMLLRTMGAKPGDNRHKIYNNLLLVATKNRSNVDQALANFEEMLTGGGTESVGVLYGIAVAHMVLKQQQKAMVPLLQISKMPWNMFDATYQEASWLLLADHYIYTSKNDAAVELLQRCLSYNKSCCKAYEYLGYITERDQAHREAAVNYEMAWKYGNKNVPAVGYKLAFNYLKSKRYVEAIDICHHVLAKHPTYPKIRKEILDKARMSIRT